MGGRIQWDNPPPINSVSKQFDQETNDELGRVFGGGAYLLSVHSVATGVTVLAELDIPLLDKLRGVRQGFARVKERDKRSAGCSVKAY